MTDAAHAGREDLVALAERVEGWRGRIASLDSLHGGMTNRNVKVTLDDGTAYVLRLAGKDTDLLGISRTVELAAQRHAARLGVAPEPVAFLEPEGYLVTRFVDAAPITALDRPDVLAQVGSHLAMVHAGPPLATTFGCFLIARRYDAIATSRGRPHHPQFERIANLSARIESAFAANPEPDVPSHNDLLAANFLGDADGRIWLIDWEYAAMNNRWFDLGNLSINNGLDDDARDALVAAYRGTRGPDPLERAKLDVMTVVSDVREAMWGVAQDALSTIDFDYLGYADTHVDRLFTTATTPRFERALALVAR